MDKIPLIHELGTANNRIAELEATLADAADDALEAALAAQEKDTP